MRFGIALLLILCLPSGYSGQAGAGLSDPWQDLVFSVPLRIEPPRGRDRILAPYVRSPLKIQLRAKTYDHTVGVLADGRALDEAERALVQLVQVVRTRDRQAFSELVRPGEYTEQLFQRTVDGWSGIEEEAIRYQVTLGPLRVFLASKHGQCGREVPFVRQGDRVYLAPNAYSHPMMQVLSGLAGALDRQTDEFRPTSKKEGLRWVDIPWDEGADLGPRIVVGFEGAAADWPVFGTDADRAAPPWAGEPLRVYAEAVQAIHEGRYEEYLAHLGPASREGTLEWLEKLKAENRLDTARWLVRSARRVVYAMRGEGLVVLFYHEWSSERVLPLKYSFLAANGEGGWRLVNTTNREFLDRLLAWPPFQEALLNGK
jgi:hypothetical protein